MSEGFLRTAAPLYADLILVLEMSLGLALLVGAVLARKGKYRAHAWCQSTVVLLNLAVIASTMVPSFHARVSPKIPARLNKPFYALATTHAAVGTAAEVLALYVLVAAGTRVLPERFRITKYKSWMRGVFALWWIALVLGLATYVRWYVPW